MNGRFGEGSAASH